MKRKILFSLGSNSFSNIEFTNDTEFSDEDWSLMRLELSMAKELIEDTLPNSTSKVKMISNNQESIIRKYQDTEKDLILDYLKSISKSKLSELTMEEASAIIDKLFKKPKLEVSEPETTPEPEVIPDWVEPQRPEKCGNCGNTEFKLLSGSKQTGGKWYGFKCTNANNGCDVGLVFAKPNISKSKLDVMANKTSEPLPDKTDTAPKITSKDGLPEWAMKQFIAKNIDIKGREFEFISYVKEGKDRYMFKSKDGKGGFMDKGMYFVNAPVKDNYTNYEM